MIHSQDYAVWRQKDKQDVMILMSDGLSAAV